MLAEIGPEVHAVDFDHHECRNGEDGGSHQRFAHRCRGARDILLENGPVKMRQPEQSNGNHRRRNGGGDGLPCFHAEISVSRAENQSEQKADRHGLDGHLGRRFFGRGRRGHRHEESMFSAER